MKPQTIEQLAQGFGGRLLRPQDQGYDEARHVHNGSIDKHPALIARCLSTADIVDALKFARGEGLEIAVRGGGHNVAGNAVCDDGMVIDLSAMKGAMVDPRVHRIRCQGGVTWGEFNRQTQLHGLASTGGAISSTGVAGLTLGGGIGWLMGKYGLALDNLVSAEIVTANGAVVMTSADDEPDLFWAIRGGGGNFGIAASFEFQVYPVGPTVIGGVIAHPFTDAREVLRYYREVTAEGPDELSVFCGLLHAPDGSGTPIAALMVCHCGPLAEAEAAVAPIKGFGSPIEDGVGPISYCDMNTILDDGFPRGARNYWKSNVLPGLSDDAIDTLVSQFERCPSPMSGLLLENIHGAVTRVSPTETAFPLRDPGYNFLAVSEWLDAAEDERNVAWAKETYVAMEPFLSTALYSNYMTDDEGLARVQASYGVNFERLQALKSTYDPDNVLHLNQNIPPA